MDRIVHSFLSLNTSNGYVGWFGFIYKVLLFWNKDTPKTFTQDFVYPVMMRQSFCFEELLTRPNQQMNVVTFSE